MPRNKASELRKLRTATGAGATGASAGTLLVLLARTLPDPWKSLAVTIAPSLSVLLSWFLIKVRHEAEYYLAKRNQQRVFEAITAKIREALDNPLTSEEHKASMRKQLEQVEKLRIDAEREQLQLVLKEAD